jgi:AraC-like DNA-binding protein
LYCTKGLGFIEIDNQTYELHGEEAFCIPRGKKHRYYADEKDPWNIFWFHVKGDNVGFYPLTNCEIITLTSRHSNSRLLYLFDVLFTVLNQNYTLGNFIYMSQILQLILSEVYFREKKDETSTGNKHLTTIIRYMYKHITKQLTLADLSREFELSKSYINIIFNNYTSRSPIDFFIDLKMQEACKLLKSTNMFVKEVSAELGYDDPYYFSRIFKKIIGMSPRAYQNKTD